MSTAQDNGDTFDALWVELERARKVVQKATGNISQHTLWVEYAADGGTIDWDTFRNYLRGKPTPRLRAPHEYNRAAKVINEQLAQLGRKELPYVELVPPPRGRRSKRQMSYSRQTSLAA